MKVGSLVFATDQGLGVLAKDFVDNGVVTDVIVVKHGSRENHTDWYPNSMMLSPSELSGGNVNKFIQSMDAMLYFETPFNWSLFDVGRQLGTPSILMPMHECCPDPMPCQPDAIISPSGIEEQKWPDTFIPVPVPNWIQWRQRARADVFVHNAGHGGLIGRNGTKELVESLQHIKSPIKLILRSQDPLDWHIDTKIGNVDLDLRIGNFDREELYVEGDVFVFPEKFNGLSLPLQEACASGMLVMATNRFPMNDWLPRDPLIPVASFFNNQISPRLMQFAEAKIDPLDIAATIDRWYGKRIDKWSTLGLKYLQENSWSALKGRYFHRIEQIVHDFKKDRSTTSC